MSLFCLGKLILLEFMAWGPGLLDTDSLMILKAHSSFIYMFWISIKDITSSNVWTKGPESECKCLFACEKNYTLSVPLFCTELIFIRDIGLFVCLFFFLTSPKLDGVRVTKRGTMPLCLKRIRWHEKRRILRIPYSQFEIERNKSRNYIDNLFDIFK